MTRAQLARREFLRDGGAHLAGAALGASALGWGCSEGASPTEPPDAGDPSGFVPDAPFVSLARSGYADPEFSETTSQLVFQDPQNRIWIGDLDPATGLLRTATGRDYLVDENLPIIIADHQRPAGSTDCYGNMPSRFENGRSHRLVFTDGWSITQAKAAWIFTDRSDAWHTLEGFDPFQMSMWSAVSPEFLFIRRATGSSVGQVAAPHADTGAVRVLTNDAGEKNDAGFFLAPGYGGEKCLVARVDNWSLGIYRDVGASDGFWKRVATLLLPASSPHPYLFTTEVIAPATGIGGVSYFPFNASRTNDWSGAGDRAIWVLGLGSDERNRFARRIDDGALSGRLASRWEPEPFLGTRDMYVYYNFYDTGTGEYGLRCARTGLGQ